MKIKRLFCLILALLTLMSLEGCGGQAESPAAEQPASAAVSEQVTEVMRLIDEIGELNEDGSNAENVYAQYSAAMKAYFALDYDLMGQVANVGRLWHAVDSYGTEVLQVSKEEAELNAFNEQDTAEYLAKVAEAGRLLSGTWYDSSNIMYQEGRDYVIYEDGSVLAPWMEVAERLEVFTDGSYYIPAYGTVYPDYSMGTVRLAKEDGTGCLIRPETAAEMFVSVELSQANAEDYITWDRLWSFKDEWGDYADYSDKNRTAYALIDRQEGQGITYIGCFDFQLELLLSGGSSYTVYGLGETVLEGKNISITGLGRAKGSLFYVRDEFVDSVVPDEWGGVTVTLNDGSSYYYYHGSFAFG